MTKVENITPDKNITQQVMNNLEQMTHEELETLKAIGEGKIENDRGSREFNFSLRKKPVNPFQLRR